MAFESMALFEALCLEVGDIILSYYGPDCQKDIRLKSDASPVTAADRAADAFLRKKLHEIAQHPILSEESPDDGERLKSDMIWLVDPLDGTRDFIGGTDEFAVNISLIDRGRPIFGLIYVPVKQHMYYAQKGSGAYWIDLGEKKGPVRLATQDRADNLVLLKSRYSQSDAHKALEDQRSHAIARIDTVGSCIKGCVIAKGAAQGYYRFGLTSEWDTAPMDLIVREAGGYLLDMSGDLIRYNREDVVNRKGFYVVSGPQADLIKRR